MRVVFHIARLGGGGAERVLVLLANYFACQGHTVFVVANKPYECEYSLDAAVKKMYLDSSDKDGVLERNLKRMGFIRNLCRNEKIDCLISFMAEPNIRSIVACLGLKTKNIVSVRNDPNKEYPGKLLPIARWLFRLADRVILQTSQAKEVFKYLGDRAAIIPNPVSSSFYDVVADPMSTRIVTAGRLEGQKNQELLIRAFAGVSSDYPETTLDIFGEGSLRSHLSGVADELQIGERVIFHGRSSDMARELADAGIFVLSSDYEGMPNALMEALAAGIPSIATDCPCGGPADLIDTGENGILVPVGSIQGMEDGLRALLLDVEARIRLSQGSKKSMEGYKTEKICKRWEEVVSECISG